MLAVIAEFESDVNSERTISAMSQKKAMGEKYAHIPFGYSELDGRLVQVEAEALVVAEIVKQRGAGVTLQLIAQTLNEQGIVGKQGGKWYASSVRCILHRQSA